MNPEKEEQLSFTTILFITGASCLVFTAFMKLLNEQIHPFFSKAGIAAITACIILGILRFLTRYAASGKKQAKKHPQ